MAASNSAQNQAFLRLLLQRFRRNWPQSGRQITTFLPHRTFSMALSKESQRLRFLEKLKPRFNNTLIGKFSQGTPSLDAVRKFLAVQNFQGTVLVGLIDKKQTLLRFEFPEDYIRLFSKSIWNVNGKQMCILKWTSKFCIDREPPIVPIWLSLHMLPIHLVNESFIFSLDSSFSKPLRIDSATENLKKPSVARVQVEIDLLQLLPFRVWVQSEAGHGFWQAIELEKPLPPYCRYCWHIGHQEHFCTVKYPELQHTYPRHRKPSTYAEYRPKEQHMGVWQESEDENLSHNMAVTESDDLGHSGLAQASMDKGKMQLKSAEAIPLGYINTAFSKNETRETSKLAEQQSTYDAENSPLESSALDASQLSANILANATAQENGLCAPDKGLNPSQNGFGMDINQKVSTAADKDWNAENEADVSALQLGKRHGKVENVLGADILDPKSDENILGKLGTKDLDLTPHLVFKGIVVANDLPTSNPFEMLSIPGTDENTKDAVANSTGIDSRNSVLDELQNIDRPKARLTGYISDRDTTKDTKMKLTPAQKAARFRKPKKVFDL